MKFCGICHQEAKEIHALGSGPTYRVHAECETCGQYDALGAVLEHLARLTDADSESVLLPYLSAHVRQATDACEPILLTENWRELAQSHADTPATPKLGYLVGLEVGLQLGPNALDGVQ